jgi:tight adherence protein B
VSVDLLISGIRAGLTPMQALEIERDSIEQMSSEDRAEFWELWELALRVGSPITDALEMIQVSMEQRRRFLAELENLSSTPAATRQLLTWLPIIGLAVAQVIGLDPFSALSSTLGLLVFCFSIGLFVLGAVLSSRINKRLSASLPRSSLKPLKAAIRLQAGVPLGKIKLDQKIFIAALEGGSPLAKILIQQFLHNQQAEFEKKRNLLAKDSVKLLLPLGLTSLPAFVLITVFPLLISSFQMAII